MASRVVTIGLLMVASAAIVAIMHRDKFVPGGGEDGMAAAAATAVSSANAVRERTGSLTGRIEPVKTQEPVESQANDAPESKGVPETAASSSPATPPTPAPAATPAPAVTPAPVATPAPAVAPAPAAARAPTATRAPVARLANARIAEAAPGVWYVQMAARPTIDEADAFRRARPDRADALVVQVQGPNPQFSYVVLAGPFPSREAAATAQRRDGMPADAWVRTARALQAILANDGDAR
jgi:septal ring-binding cell division protein DamX